MNYTDTHRDVIAAFQSACNWNYEVRCALRAMCGYKYEKIDFHMYRVIMSMKEYWMLQVSKLFDAKFTFNDPAKTNLVLAYVIEEIPWPETVRDRLSALRSQMEFFSGQLKDSRNKVIAHQDLVVHTKHSGKWFGTFSMQDEERFYQFLLEFLNLVQAEINGSPPLEWPHFAEGDGQEFMKALEIGGYAVADDA